MKTNQIITETPVMSSWIEDLEPSKNGVVMTLGNGNEYMITGVPGVVFKSWLAAPSKGRFWHQRIKNRYVVNRTA